MQREPERRRRDDILKSGTRLGVNMDLLDFKKYAYRWLNDKEARIFQKTAQDDWDIVKSNGDTIKADNSDLGDAISVVVGVKPDGSALRAFLLRKPLKYYEDDEKKKAERLDEQLSQLRRGNTAAGALQGDYVPQGGIKIA